MTYSRKELNDLKGGATPKYNEVVQELFNRVTAHEDMSIAEEAFICSCMMVMNPSPGMKKINIEEFSSCQNYVFRSKYLHYYDNLDGSEKAFNYKGQIPAEQVAKDIASLNENFESWKGQLASSMNGSGLINYVSQEVNYQLKELEKHIETNEVTSDLKNYLVKSIYLHSKYLYLLVKEFFQEKSTERIELQVGNHVVLVDGFMYVHTMFRHYSEDLFKHLKDKSYHLARKVEFKELPDFIVKVVKAYKSMGDVSLIETKVVYFDFNGSKYAIWFRMIKQSIKGIGAQEFYRAQTFYRVESQDELTRISGLTERTTDDIVFYI